MVINSKEVFWFKLLGQWCVWNFYGLVGELGQGMAQVLKQIQSFVCSLCEWDKMNPNEWRLFHVGNKEVRWREEWVDHPKRRNRSNPSGFAEEPCYSRFPDMVLPASTFLGYEWVVKRLETVIVGVVNVRGLRTQQGWVVFRGFLLIRHSPSL